MPIKDMHGNVLEEWPKCIACGTELGHWEGDRYFCYRLRCPAHWLPQDTLCTVDVDGEESVVLIDYLDKLKERGYKVVRLGVGARVVE